MPDSKKRVQRLAASYLAIIMAMSLIFSGILYTVAAVQLSDPLPDRDDPRGQLFFSNEQRSRLGERTQQTRLSLIASLVLLNMSVLGFGAWFSLFLARRTLRPIEEAMDMQNQFISDASHELRTPLTALQAVNEVALRKKSLDDKKARAVLNKNIVEIERLHSLADALLELTKVEKSARTHETIELAPFLQSLVGELQGAASQKNIMLDLQIKAQSVIANRMALTQIITNLVDNAIKYSPEKTTVTIAAEQTKQDVIVRVSDQGIGLAKEDQVKIFDRFYRVDNARTDAAKSGYGLGLSIVKALCAKYGYILHLDSTLGKGSTFTVHLPLKGVE